MDAIYLDHTNFKTSYAEFYDYHNDRSIKISGQFLCGFYVPSISTAWLINKHHQAQMFNYKNQSVTNKLTRGGTPNEQYVQVVWTANDKACLIKADGSQVMRNGITGGPY